MISKIVNREETRKLLFRLLNIARKLQLETRIADLVLVDNMYFIYKKLPFKDLFPWSFSLS